MGLPSSRFPPGPERRQGRRPGPDRLGAPLSQRPVHGGGDGEAAGHIGCDNRRMRALIEGLLDRADAFQQRRRWLSLPVPVIRKMSSEQGGSMAARSAYYGFLSVFPLLLVFAAILGFVLGGDPGLKERILQTTESSFPLLSGYINSTLAGSNTALGVGLAGALWAGLGVTRATERAMNNIWDIPLAERPNLWWSRLRGLGMLCVLGSTFLVSTALAGLGGVGGPLRIPADVAAFLGPVALNLVLFLLAFQILTNRHQTWRGLLPGAVAGAVGWSALQNLGAFYLRHEVAHASQLYGSLGMVVVLLAWIYLGAQLTLYAAELNVVLAYRLWPRSLRKDAVTDADRRALELQAKEAQRSVGEVVTIGFEVDMQAASGGPAVPGAEPTAQPGGEPPAEVRVARAHLSEVVAHFERLESGVERLGACGEKIERDLLLADLSAVAAEISQSLNRLLAGGSTSSRA